MSSKNYSDTSVKVTSFYLKIVGFWVADDFVEERRRTIAMLYTLAMLLGAIFIEGRDIYFSWGDFTTSVYVTCNVASIAIGVMKIIISFVHKRDLLNLVRYAQKNFWHLNYDPYEQKIVNSCKRTCTLLICIFNFFAQGTVATYIIRPIMANMGKNESERVLPFNMWLNLPLAFTPYFEIAFVIQVLVAYHVGVCYLCFDNFLCILNLHTAGQFRILQYRIINLYGKQDYVKKDKLSKNLQYDTIEYYRTLRNYIQQHQALIEFCRKLEKVFTLIVLGQVLLFSFMMCLDGYLVLMEDVPNSQRITFMFHITGCMVQLLMFTYSCDSLIRDSSEVAKSAYENMWTLLPMDKFGKMMRRDLSFVIMRAQTPCCLTAGGFFAVSLETFTTVLSSAVSYFTLLTHY